MASCAAIVLLKTSKNGRQQIELASTAKFLAQQALEEIEELGLKAAHQLEADLQGVITLLTLFLKFDGDISNFDLIPFLPEPSPCPRASEWMDQTHVELLHEATDLFATSEGWMKFRVYKALEVATDTLFLLESTLKWPHAGLAARCFQRSLFAEKEFTVKVEGGHPSSTQWT